MARTEAAPGSEMKVSGSCSLCGISHSFKWPTSRSKALRSSGEPERRTSEEKFSTTLHGTSREIESRIRCSWLSSVHSTICGLRVIVIAFSHHSRSVTPGVILRLDTHNLHRYERAFPG